MENYKGFECDQYGSVFKDGACYGKLSGNESLKDWVEDYLNGDYT